MLQEPIDKKVLNLNMGKKSFPTFSEIWAYIDKSNNIQKLCLVVIGVCGYAHYNMWSLLGLSDFEYWWQNPDITSTMADIAEATVNKYRTIADIGLFGSIIVFVLFRDKR